MEPSDEARFAASDKKIIAVIGATGQQGGSVARALLKDGQFAVRAITRNPKGEKARALEQAGAEVMAADMGDERSLERAFTGVYGAFLVTNYWETMSVETEQQQIQNLLDAVRATHVQHVVWSSLDAATDALKNHPEIPTVNGPWKVPHFDGKAAFNHAFLEECPSTVLLASFYYENYIVFGMGPKLNASTGKYQIVLDVGKGAQMPAIAVNDIGKSVAVIFENPYRFIGKTVGIAGSFLTMEETAKVFSEVLGIDCEYVELSFEQYRGLGFPGADDLGNMFAYYTVCEKEFVASRQDKIIQYESFRDWLQTHKHEIKL